MRHGWWMWIAIAGCDDVLFGEATGGSAEGPSQDGYAGVVEIATGNCYGCHSAEANTTAGFDLDLETDLHATTVGVSQGLLLAVVFALITASWVWTFPETRSRELLS